MTSDETAELVRELTVMISRRDHAQAEVIEAARHIERISAQLCLEQPLLVREIASRTGMAPEISGFGRRRSVDGKLTLTDYARRHSCDRRQVQEAIRKGHIASPALTPDRLIDPEMADLQLAQLGAAHNSKLVVSARRAARDASADKPKVEFPKSLAKPVVVKAVETIPDAPPAAMKLPIGVQIPQIKAAPSPALEPPEPEPVLAEEPVAEDGEDAEFEQILADKGYVGPPAPVTRTLEITESYARVGSLDAAEPSIPPIPPAKADPGVDQPKDAKHNHWTRPIVPRDPPRAPLDPILADLRKIPAAEVPQENGAMTTAKAKALLISRGYEVLPQKNGMWKINGRMQTEDEMILRIEGILEREERARARHEKARQRGVSQ